MRDVINSEYRSLQAFIGLLYVVVVVIIALDWNEKKFKDADVFSIEIMQFSLGAFA